MEFLIWLALIPSIIIAILIYRADKKEKEPKLELLKSFLMGVLSVIITLILSYVFNVTNLYPSSNNLFEIFIYSFIAISLIEEFSKWLSTYLFLRKNKNFDYLFDGIVYASFVALGFATIENILYTITGGIMTGIIRAITTVPAHVFFGIGSGYYFSFYKDKKDGKYLFLSIFVPFLLHGFYDFCLLSDNLVLFIIYLVFVVGLYITSINRVKKMMRIEKLFKK